MVSLILASSIITALYGSASVEQIVATNSLVRLPKIQLGNGSGVKIWAERYQSEQSIAFEEGSGEAYPENKNDQSKNDIAYFTTYFEGNSNTWSLNVNSMENYSKSLCYNPVQNKVRK